MDYQFINIIDFFLESHILNQQFIINDSLKGYITKKEVSKDDFVFEFISDDLLYSIKCITDNSFSNLDIILNHFYEIEISDFIFDFLIIEKDKKNLDFNLILKINDFYLGIDRFDIKAEYDISNTININREKKIFEKMNNAFFKQIQKIITDYTNISHATNLWRCLTHWLGGMGLLVFMLAIIPMSGGQTMHIMKAESPGPVVGKLVPRMRQTAGILYKIYFALTVVELALLVISGVPFFDSVCYTFATAGTGGFSISNAGFSEYSVASKVIITVFMILFGVNFNTYYFSKFYSK